MEPQILLVVDDDPEFCRLVRALLSRPGRVVLCARSGAEATEVIERVPVQLAVVDGLLPDTTGIDWIARRRALTDHTAIVFVSSFWRDLPSYRRLTDELAVQLVVRKPIDPRRFVDQIERLLPACPVLSAG